MHMLSTILCMIWIRLNVDCLDFVVVVVVVVFFATFATLWFTVTLFLWFGNAHKVTRSHETSAILPSQLHNEANTWRRRIHVESSRPGQIFWARFQLMVCVHPPRRRTMLMPQTIHSFCLDSLRPAATRIMGNRVATLEFQLRAWSPWAWSCVQMRGWFGCDTRWRRGAKSRLPAMRIKYATINHEACFSWLPGVPMVSSAIVLHIFPAKAGFRECLHSKCVPQVWCAPAPVGVCVRMYPKSRWGNKIWLADTAE